MWFADRVRTCARPSVTLATLCAKSESVRNGAKSHLSQVNGPLIFVTAPARSEHSPGQGEMPAARANFVVQDGSWPTARLAPAAGRVRPRSETTPHTDSSLERVRGTLGAVTSAPIGVHWPAL